MALAVAVPLSGCGKPDDEYAPAVAPKTVAFDGKIDDHYIGNWVETTGESKMGLQKDGALSIETTLNSMKGKSTTYVTGKWLVNGPSLLLEYLDKGGKPMVLKYAAELNGNSLTLKQGNGRLKSTYSRK